MVLYERTTGKWAKPTDLYLIYLEIALSNKRRIKKHGGFEPSFGVGKTLRKLWFFNTHSLEDSRHHEKFSQGD